MMENIMLSLKYLLFLAMEIAVVALVVAVLIAAVYQVVREKVLEARRQDAITSEFGSEAAAAPRGS